MHSLLMGTNLPHREHHSEHHSAPVKNQPRHKKTVKAHRRHKPQVHMLSSPSLKPKVARRSHTHHRSASGLSMLRPHAHLQAPTLPRVQHKTKPGPRALSDVLHNHLSANGAKPDLPKPVKKAPKAPVKPKKQSKAKPAKKPHAEEDDDMMDEQGDSSDLDMGFHQEKQAAAANGLLDP